MATSSKIAKKNHRTYLSHKRKAARARARISSEPPFRRTLRLSARSQLRKEKLAAYIHPWVRDLAFRLQPTAYPRASLLGLPKEIRQQILLLSMPEMLGRKQSEYCQPFFSCPRAARSAKGKWLGKRIGELCVVSPVVRVDMAYVGGLWMKELLGDTKREGQGKVKKEGKVASGWVERGRKGRVIEVQTKKKMYREMRAQKCWYCEERHPIGDPACPLERREPAKWYFTTKANKVRSRDYRLD
ncbi:hypothetical protein N0V90_010449 [Kalmusia sp. IMI 367209]|nr:hypothetical protein N0V90_010449 [Kalmusia sp. IMI 367209]